jgi:amidohydrolase
MHWRFLEMTMKKKITEVLDGYFHRIREIALFIGNHPELGHEEFQASALLAAELEKQQFHVKRGVLGLPTAFIAEYDSGVEGPTIALLAEYDALPELGHACGHHLICTMSLGAAVGLKAVLDELGGKVRVYGTPAEETKGAKVTMASSGLFDDVDAALMAHPYYTYEASGDSLAMDALQFEYSGKSAHAAASPDDGINALDAVIQLFNGINALRQQTRSDTRIHGIITEGGKAPNIIPDRAVARFYVRSRTRAYTDELTHKVIRCAEGAALQTGCELVVSNYEYSYDELRTNEMLSGVFNRNMLEAGITEAEIEHGKDHGSLDLGNVSIRCPAIHPYVKVCDEKYLLHTPEFRDLAMTERAMQGMLLGAKLLAHTAYDVIADPQLLAAIKKEFQAGRI